MLSASLAVTFEVLPRIFTDWVEAMLPICPTMLRKVLNKNILYTLLLLVHFNIEDWELFLLQLGKLFWICKTE